MQLETWAEIDLDALRHNIAQVKKLAGTAEVMLVLKGDAYSHGAVEVMKVAQENGLNRFAVANFYEAMELRTASNDADILIFGYVGPDNIPIAIEQRLMLTVFSAEYWRTIEPHVCRPVTVHIKVNTGFNRLGFDPLEVSYACIKSIIQTPLVSVESIYSHLALTSRAEDILQYNRLTDFCAQLENKGVTISKRHIADSISSVIYAWARLDMIRVGALLYGLKAAGYREYDTVDLRTTFKLYGTVSQVRTLRQGEGVSYDYIFRAPHDMPIATLTLGYADGMPRRLSGRGHVVINGKRCPILELVCMDQSIVDISGAGDVRAGDKALIYDLEEDSEASIYQISTSIGTNKTDILAALGRRVTRVYKQDGQVKYVNSLWDDIGRVP